jgi:hypothetical protein
VLLLALAKESAYSINKTMQKAHYDARGKLIMKCPICKTNEHVDYDLHSAGFAEDIMECRVCGSSWSVAHGATELIRDTQETSFLGAQTVCVEGYDYSFAA